MSVGDENDINDIGGPHTSNQPNAMDKYNVSMSKLSFIIELIL